MSLARYDPFEPGRHDVGVTTRELRDARREREFRLEIWYPARPGEPTAGVEAPVERREAETAPGAWPLVVYSHPSGGHRRSATYLCAHVASHGYVVAALDHSEVVAPELRRSEDESDAETADRIDAIIAARVPDVVLAIDHLLDAGAGPGTGAPTLDPQRIGLIGHSFGGWTVLATPEVDPRVKAVVAIAPGGASRPRPGILPATLSFAWSRDVPTLVLTGDADVMTPLDGVVDVFRRTPGTKRLFVLGGADHLHFVDDAEAAHESLREEVLPGDAAWIPAAMRPFAELVPEERAHAFAQGLSVVHLDAYLLEHQGAAELLDTAAHTELRRRGIRVVP